MTPRLVLLGALSALILMSAASEAAIRRPFRTVPPPKPPVAPTPAAPVTQGLEITVRVIPAAPVAYRDWLEQSAPNPSRGPTVIRYSVASRGNVSIKIFSVTGQAMATLVNRVHDPGLYSIGWDCRDNEGRLLAPGIYIYRMECGRFVKTRKLTMLH